MQFRRSVTHVAGRFCYLCPRLHTDRATMPRIPRSILLVALLLAPSRVRAQVIDLSCDVLVFEPQRDSARFGIKRGEVDSAHLAANLGRLVVRPAPLRPEEKIQPPFWVSIYRSDGRLSARPEWFATAPFVVADSAGRVRAEVTCSRCNETRVWLELAPGRTDTLDVSLTRLRSTCEIDSTKRALDMRRTRPPNGGWCR